MIKKNIWIVLILFFLGQDLVSAQGVDQGCFEKFGEIDVNRSGALKVKLYPQRDMYFIQGNKGLPYKIFDFGDSKKINFKIEEDILKSNSERKFLVDGNLSTGAEIDLYKNKKDRVIFIKADNILRSGEFDFKINYQGGYYLTYEASKDGIKYISVKNPEGVDWKNLKITFRKNRLNQPNEKIFIREIYLTKKDKSILLLNSRGEEKILAFSNYFCQDRDGLRKYYSLKKDNYSLDIETPTFILDWKNNPDYNKDLDGDGIDNEKDNCPFIFNSDQNDMDGDLKGDKCDFDNEKQNFNEIDSDSDGVGNGLDNCPYIFNLRQKDSNGDGIGDMCSDDDGDGILGYLDNCPLISNRNQRDVNNNGVGDSCEFDKDKDGIFDSVDNCINKANPKQEDDDGDGIGNACDNCSRYNPQQWDKNNNGVGDVCEEYQEFLDKNDKDNDGILNYKDNCPSNPNPEQEDKDKDGIGDACDNCLSIKNQDQRDDNKNRVGDFCEDIDNDGILGYLDNCPYQSNPKQGDKNNDGMGDVCEDEDFDGVIFAKDNCPYEYNPNQKDIDNDGKGDVCNEKDDRFFESNRWVIIGIILLVIMAFAFAIMNLLKKLKSIEK